MTLPLSANTKAILLLTAPLIAGSRPSSQKPLAPGEYNRLARRLRETGHEPADLVSSGADEIIQSCASIVAAHRLQQLLGRGFLLSQSVEQWHAHAIWVVSRADDGYPRRLRQQLREKAPPVLYGCGDIGLLDAGGLAVVGSRHVDDELIKYTIAVGSLAAAAGWNIVSGGARGVDQAAMRGALEAGGKACGVLADSLLKTVLRREHRNQILDEQLTLVSPYDPNVGFNVGNAMQRNKVIYALADAALVVNSDVKKGGTWSGAVEQLETLRNVPVYVRSTGEPSPGLDGLRAKGALPWPEPRDRNDLAQLLDQPATTVAEASHPTAISFETPFPDGGALAYVTLPPGQHEPSDPAAEADVLSAASSKRSRVAAEVLYAAVRSALEKLLTTPMSESEVAAALEVSSAQARAWLRRLVADGVLEKQTRPAVYVVKQRGLFG